MKERVNGKTFEEPKAIPFIPVAKNTQLENYLQDKPLRCEGWRRHGGAFTLGPVKWVQCEAAPIVMLKFEEDHNCKTLPACNTCWKECIAAGVKILEVKPIG